MSATRKLSRTGFWEMTDEASGRGVAHPSIIAVLDLHGRLSLDSTAMRPAAIRGEQHPVLSVAHEFMKVLAMSKASVQLRNGADELVAPRMPSSQRGSGPTRVGWEIVSGSESRSGAGA
jgi:hypothetical protein